MMDHLRVLGDRLTDWATHTNEGVLVALIVWFAAYAVIVALAT